MGLTPLSSDDRLALIAAGTSHTSGDIFFESIVHSIAMTLTVDYCFVAECIDQNIGYVTTLALWAKDRFSENITYDSHGTPCEDTLGTRYGHDGAILDREWANTAGPKEFLDKSYLGAAMIDSFGDIVGHIAVLDKPGRIFTLQDEWTLRIFAARAGSELTTRYQRNKRMLATSDLDAAQIQNKSHLRIAHDLNNLLFVIQANLELAPELLDRKTNMLGATRRALSLTESMLDPSATNNRTDLTSILEELAELLNAANSNIKVTLVADGETIVECDHIQIYRLFLNLIVNAIQSINDSSGQVTISLRESKKVGDNNRSTAEIQITDTGKGIETADLERIFEAGFTAHGGGSHFGIGLSTARSIIDLHNGTITVASKPLVGTTFTVTLPTVRHARV